MHGMRTDHDGAEAEEEAERTHQAYVLHQMQKSAAVYFVREVTEMKKYKVREGSIVDHARACALAAGFWAVIFGAIVTTYPL